ncbi:MAG TPA: SIR2 family protein [Candidatus Deferrimicrobium sp.]|nr:SIR2 family protein [Candidatus Kapabacteria bacterium]HLP57679.1 SIR2 family protein [Candidatus Deferrimicrobium sp.]
MELTSALAFDALQKIFNSKKFLLIIGTGASCALDHRFGMPALAKELKDKVPGEISTKTPAMVQWKEVEQKLDNGKDLETSLNGINDEKLLAAIIQVTGNFIAKLDKENKIKIASGEKEPPLEKLIRARLEGLPPNDPTMDIITPNYDLLIEHTCDKLKIPYCTGFKGGIRRHYDWERAEEELAYIKSHNKGKKKAETKHLRKHVRLHKVHGSINRFGEGIHGVEDNSLVYELSSCIGRGIITPGDTKNEKIATDFREFFSHADESIARAEAYIFVGYGFNDVPIETKIKNELEKKDKHVVVITKEFLKKSEDWLNKKNLWAVYQDKADESNSIIKNEQYNNPLIIKKSSIWRIDEFAKEVLLGEGHVDI